MSAAETHAIPDAGVEPQGPLAEAAGAFYTLLQGQSASTLGVASDALPALQARLAEHRLVVVQLRQLVRRAEEEHLRLEAAVATLSRVVEPDAEPAGLRGRRLADTAIVLLRDLGRGDQDVHYGDWFRLVQDAGHIVLGADPVATFLTAIARHPDVVKVPPARSGVYRVEPRGTA